MSTFEVIVLGVGDAFSELHHGPSLLLTSGSFYLAVDCPDTYPAVLRRASERCGRSLALSSIDHVLITHVHGDHVNGLEAVAFYKHFAESKRVQLATSSEVREVIWDQRLKASMGSLWDGATYRTMAFEDYFDFTPLSWLAETVIGPFRIRTFRTVHHVSTSALLIEAAGRVLGYSCDTAFDRELIRFLEQADLIVHETNLGPAHTPYEALLSLPADVRRRMRLIHYPDGFDPEPDGIPLLCEGDVLSP
ncbi:MBL fold metallo-hydrolase [Planctomycetota bacterium]